MRVWVETLYFLLNKQAFKGLLNVIGFYKGYIEFVFGYLKFVWLLYNTYIFVLKMKCRESKKENLVL